MRSLIGTIAVVLAAQPVNVIAPRPVAWTAPAWCAEVTDARAVVGLLCAPPDAREALSRSGVMGDEPQRPWPMDMPGSGGTGDEARPPEPPCEPRSCSIGCNNGTSCSATAPPSRYAVCVCLYPTTGAHCNTAPCP